MNAKGTPEYKARLDEAKCMSRAALLAWVTARGFTEADGVHAMENSMLRRMYAADRAPVADVALSHVTTHVVG